MTVTGTLLKIFFNQDGETAGWVECFLHKHEDYSFMPQTCIKMTGVVVCLKSQFWGDGNRVTGTLGSVSFI